MKSPSSKILELENRLNEILKDDDVLMFKIKTEHRGLYLDGFVPHMLEDQYCLNGIIMQQIKTTINQIEIAIKEAKSIMGKKKVTNEELSSFFDLPQDGT